MFQSAIEYLFSDYADVTHMESIIRGVGSNSPPHRSPGTRARRQWKRCRAAGITKRVRS
jgi:hypothetical protein